MYSLIPVLLFTSNILGATAQVIEKPYYHLDEAEKHFEDFIEKYNKTYLSHEEHAHRFRIFMGNLHKINHLNLNEESEHRVNILSDITHEELVGTYCGYVRSRSMRSNTTELINVPKEWITEAPKSIDYRELGFVTEVKSQDACGSCFSFGAIGSVEGQFAKKYGHLVSLSEQQVFDCSSGDCNGGMPDDALSRIAEQGGVMTEKDYPYVATKGRCTTNSSKAVVKVIGAQELLNPTEEELMGALAHFGPLTATLYMSSSLHHSGTSVMSPTDCVEDEPNHAIVIVGYGTDDVTGKDYWIIKNSWTEAWADKGYFRLERGKNLCRLGVYSTVSAIIE